MKEGRKQRELGAGDYFYSVSGTLSDLAHGISMLSSRANLLVHDVLVLLYSLLEAVGWVEMRVQVR